MSTMFGQHIWIVVWIGSSLALLWIGAALRVHHDDRERRKRPQTAHNDPWGLPNQTEE